MLSMFDKGGGSALISSILKWLSKRWLDFGEDHFSMPCDAPPWRAQTKDQKIKKIKNDLLINFDLFNLSFENKSIFFLIFWIFAQIDLLVILVINYV